MPQAPDPRLREIGGRSLRPPRGIIPADDATPHHHRSGRAGHGPGPWPEAREDLPRLRPALHMAAEVGPLLGRGRVVQRPLSGRRSAAAIQRRRDGQTARRPGPRPRRPRRRTRNAGGTWETPRAAELAASLHRVKRRRACGRDDRTGRGARRASCCRVGPRHAGAVVDRAARGPATRRPMDGCRCDLSSATLSRPTRHDQSVADGQAAGKRAAKPARFRGTTARDSRSRRRHECRGRWGRFD